MPISEDDIKRIVRDNKGGTVEEWHGPSRLGSLRVWDIWVHKAGEYDIRYIAEPQTGEAMYIDGFQSLCERASEELDSGVAKLEADVKALTTEIEQLKSDKAAKRVTLYVAALVFLASIGALLYQLLRSDGVSGVAAMALLGGVVASGAVMFFGNWKGAKANGELSTESEQ